MSLGKIYELISPIDNKPFYVGKTINSLENRLSKHFSKTISKIKYDKKLSKNEYFIKKLISLSLKELIIIKLIEECSVEIINEREIFWISEYRKTFKLTNLTEGGDGGSGCKHTKESLKKMSENRKGKYCGVEHHNYNKKLSEEHYLKFTYKMKYENPNIGKKHSDETKKKISYANSGEKNGMYGKSILRTDEQKKNLSESLKNSEKLKESRKSKEFKDRLSKHFSIPIIVLDEHFNIIHEFNNCKECSIFFGYTNSNVANAIRFRRRLGRKYWVVRKDNYEVSINEIKEGLIN